jgi:EmrB/QacA subfamily drug resistance transporter
MDCNLLTVNFIYDIILLYIYIAENHSMTEHRRDIMNTDVVNNNASLAYNKLDRKKRRNVLIAVAIGTFISAFDTSVVNIALPSIRDYYNVPLSTIQWVVMSYLLMTSSLLLTYGRMGDLYGHRKIYITGFIIFTLGSVMCGFSPTIAFLILSRMVQAVGAGMLMAMGPAIITEVTPSKDRGKALAIIAVSVSVALTTGPVLGGALASAFGWKSVFYINLPVGIIGSLWARRVIPAAEMREAQPFDIKGSVTIFVALVGLLLSINLTDQYGWSNPYILLGLTGGLFLIAMFVWIERHTDYPMMDISLFYNRLFSMSNISAVLNYMAQYSVILLMPFYLQQLKQLTPSNAGFMLIPMPLLTLLVAPISGTLSDHIDIRYIGSAGMAITSLGLVMLSNLGIDSGSIQIAVALGTVGMGVGIFHAPNNSAIMGSVPDSRRGIASGVLATMRNIGMVFGVAISGAVFSGRMHYLQRFLAGKGLAGAQLEIEAFTGALHTAFMVAAVLAGAAVITSLMRGSSIEG